MKVEMSFEQKEIQGLIIAEPEKARKKILSALEASRMHMGDAAKRLGCAHSTLLRWIAQLALARPIEVLKARAIRQGWHHNKIGGRPKGSTVETGAAPRPPWSDEERAKRKRLGRSSEKLSDRSDN